MLDNGRTISLMFALFAANIFSLIPPTGNTFPLSVISPLIARLDLTFLFLTKDTNEHKIVTPALGPSLGVAPSGT